MFELKPVKVGLAKYGSLFKDMHFVWSETLAALDNDARKHNNATKVCLINFNIILDYQQQKNHI